MVLIKKFIEREIDYSSPKNIDYIYYSARGRMYGAWVDTIDGNARNTENGVGSDPGYAEDDLIANPVYIVEEALRTEGGLDSGVDGSDIDIESFDVAGAAADGLIGDVFNDAVTDILFAFAQDKFTSLKLFGEKVGKQCGTLFFISGSGKVKAKVRRRPADYAANDEDLEVDYNDINNISFRYTPVEDVRNDITVKYAIDYDTEEPLKKHTATDATSKGTTVSGINQTLDLEEIMNCCLDSVTADAYADALLAWHKDRHIIIRFDTSHPYYQQLEIGDVIEFTNWDSDFKIYDAVPDANDLFMVQEISKNGPDKTMIEVMEVSAPG